jgi:hypothetical protein
VTEVSLPFRIGANTESRGSALCLTIWIFCHQQLPVQIWVVSYLRRRFSTLRQRRNETRVSPRHITMEMAGEFGVNCLRWLHTDNYVASQVGNSRHYSRQSLFNLSHPQSSVPKSSRGQIRGANLNVNSVFTTLHHPTERKNTKNIPASCAVLTCSFDFSIFATRGCFLRLEWPCGSS